MNTSSREKPALQTPNTYFIDDKNPPLTRWLAYVLGLQVLVWVVAHGISDTNLDGYADMLENFAWGQNWAWGSAKHPPLFAWVTGAIVPQMASRPQARPCHQNGGGSAQLS